MKIVHKIMPLLDELEKYSPSNYLEREKGEFIYSISAELPLDELEKIMNSILME